MNATDILKAIAAAVVPAERPKGFLTGTEIKDALGWSSATFSHNMRRLKAQGKVEITVVVVPTLSGRTTTVAAYKVKR